LRDYRIEIIPNGLDTEKFRPMDKKSSRDLLGLPPDRPIVLFGAVNPLADPNKGWHLLQPALKIAGTSRPDMLTVVFGADAPSILPDLGMPAVFLGRLRDDASLAAAYSAADVFVAPSVQESFCQTVSESMACGTPVAAFGATGVLDLVEHQGCGYLARPYEVEDLARGITWVMEDEKRHAGLSVRARQKAVSAFGLETVAKRYLDLYQELLLPTIEEKAGGNARH
jgi:glycosyltransferase involved in cell wall biosynthesis